MSDAIASIGAAGVTTVGTLAVTGAALNAVNKTTSRMNKSHRGGGGTKKSGNYNVWNGTKNHKKHKSMLGF